MKKIYYKKLCDEIIGCAIEVHKELGNGFLEKVYENALMLIFKEKNISVKIKVRRFSYFNQNKTL